MVHSVSVWPNLRYGFLCFPESLVAVMKVCEGPGRKKVEFGAVNISVNKGTLVGGCDEAVTFITATKLSGNTRNH